MKKVNNESLGAVHTHTHTLCLFRNEIKEIIQTKRICISILMLVMVAVISSIATHYQYFDVEKSINIRAGKIGYANSGTSNGVRYINKNDIVILNLEGTDTNYLSNSLTKEEIVVKVGGNIVTPTTKELSSPTNITNGVQYKLTLSGVSGNGELSIEIAENTLKDKVNKQNIQTIFRSGIIVDNQLPSSITPIISNIGVNSITVKTTVSDNLSGVKKIEWYYKKTTESSYKKLESNYIPFTGEQTKTLEITNLNSKTEYQIYTVTYDMLGNKIQSNTVNATTLLAIAKIETTEYAKLQDAINAQNNSTITMLQNTVENINIPSNKNIILNLSNKTVEGEVINDGNITISNGTISNGKQTDIVIKNNGILNITSGTIENKNAGGWAIENLGNLNISGGTISTPTLEGHGSAILNRNLINMSGGLINTYCYGVTLARDKTTYIPTLITTGGRIKSNSEKPAIWIKEGTALIQRTYVEAKSPSDFAILNQSTETTNIYDTCIIRAYLNNFGITGKIKGKAIATTNDNTSPGNSTERLTIYGSPYTNVSFGVWPDGYSSNLKWYSTTYNSSENSVTSLIYKSNHGNVTGMYYADVWANNSSVYMTGINLYFN